MPAAVALFTIFVASPGDILEERESLASVVSELNRTIGRHSDARFDLVRWETHAWPGFGVDAQDVINQQIPLPDIFIGVMWKRLGTPTSRAQSGTVEEFERAHKSWSEHKRPSILLYFRDVSDQALPPEETEQLEKVVQFRESLQEKGALYWNYSTPASFVTLAREHLTHELLRLVKEPLPATGAALRVPVTAAELNAASSIDWGRHSLVTEFAPCVRDLVRVADDLCTTSDYYLAATPRTEVAAVEQTRALRGAVEAYNTAWSAFWAERISIEEMLASLRGGDWEEVVEPARSTLFKVLEFPRGYDVPELPTENSDRAVRQKLEREWRRQRPALQSVIERARNALNALELQVEERATNAGAAQPLQDTACAWETGGLLSDYRAQASGLRSATLAFAGSELQDRDAAAAQAWTLAPWIESMNAAYRAIELKSLALRATLLQSGARGSVFHKLANTLRRASLFQWHEVRPLLNPLLADVILLVHNDPDPEILARIRRQEREWRLFAELLEKGSHAFNVLSLLTALPQ